MEFNNNSNVYLAAFTNCSQYILMYLALDCTLIFIILHTNIYLSNLLVYYLLLFAYFLPA